MIKKKKVRNIVSPPYSIGMNNAGDGCVVALQREKLVLTEEKLTVCVYIGKKKVFFTIFYCNKATSKTHSFLLK